MAISARSDISGLIANWRAEDSAATFDSTTGIISNFGSDLSGYANPPTFAAHGTPRMGGLGSASALEHKGMLLPSIYDGGTGHTAGLKITLGAPPAGAWYNRKLLIAVVVTHTNLNGDGTNLICRLATSNGATQSFSLSKRISIPTATLTGQSEINGGSGNQNTPTNKLNGCEKAVYVGYAHSTSGAKMLSHLAGSITAAFANGSNETITEINVGFLASSPTNGASINLIHEVIVYAYDNTTAAGTQFTGDPGNARDLADFLATAHGIPATYTNLVTRDGDSIGYCGTRYETELSSADSPVNTTLTADASAGATTLTVAERTGLSATGRLCIRPGTSLAETVVVTSGPAAGAGTITIAAPGLKYAQTSGGLVVNNGWGWIDPYRADLMFARCFGQGLGATGQATGGTGNWQIYNFAKPSSTMQQVIADPSPTGSMTPLGLSGFTNKIAIIDRGTNDMFNGARTAAQCLADAEDWATNARNAGATKVLVGEVEYRMGTSGANAGLPNPVTDTYNAALPGSGVFDGVIRYNQHPLLKICNEPGTVTGPGTNVTGATTITGVIKDPSGVHDRAFGLACRALMIDHAVYTALGQAVPYLPAAPTVTAIRSGNNVVLTWSLPASSSATVNPPSIGSVIPLDGLHTPYGSSFRCVIVRRNGSIIATVYPAGVNTNSGADDWTGRLSYTDTNPGTSYSVQVVDAAGNASSEAWITLDSGRLPRLGRLDRLARL
jgi:hypothetical protein